MVFFVWYSTNVFLTKRKKEIGTYVFMGLSNQKIGKLYMIENIIDWFGFFGNWNWIWNFTLQLFTMIIMRLSDIAIQKSLTLH